MFWKQGPCMDVEDAFKVFALCKCTWQHIVVYLGKTAISKCYQGMTLFGPKQIMWSHSIYVWYEWERQIIHRYTDCSNNVRFSANKSLIKIIVTSILIWRNHYLEKIIYRGFVVYCKQVARPKQFINIDKNEVLYMWF